MRNEIRKNGKIIEELTTFFLKKKHHQLKIDVNYTKEMTEITIILENITEAEKEVLSEAFSQIRNVTMESYAWELVGHSDCGEELNLVGMLIDDYRIEDDLDAKTTMIYLMRNH